MYSRDSLSSYAFFVTYGEQRRGAHRGEDSRASRQHPGAFASDQLAHRFCRPLSGDNVDVFAKRSTSRATGLFETDDKAETVQAPTVNLRVEARVSVY